MVVEKQKVDLEKGSAAESLFISLTVKAKETKRSDSLLEWWKPLSVFSKKYFKWLVDALPDAHNVMAWEYEFLSRVIYIEFFALYLFLYSKLQAGNLL